MAGPTTPNTLNGDTRCSGSMTAEQGFFSSVPWADENDFLSSARLPTSILVERQHKHHGQVGTVATERRSIAIMRAAGTLKSLEICITQTAHVGAATLTVDLLKNGTTVLTAPVSTSSSDAVRALKGATFASTALADGDVLELNITATAGGGTLAVGMGAELTYDENPS